MKSFILRAVISTLFISHSVFGAPKNIENPTTETVTDFSGKPPFKRRVEATTTTGVSESKRTDVSAEFTPVRQIDFRGKPPFKRRMVRVDVDKKKVAAPVFEAKNRGKNTGNALIKR